MMAEIIAHLRPGEPFTMIDEDYDSIVWLGTGNKPTQAQIEAARAEVTAARQLASKHQERRIRYAAKSDPIYLELQYMIETGEAQADIDAKRAEWVAAVQAVKAEVPL